MAAHYWDLVPFRITPEFIRDVIEEFRESGGEGGIGDELRALLRAGDLDGARRLVIRYYREVSPEEVDEDALIEAASAG